MALRLIYFAVDKLASPLATGMEKLCVRSVRFRRFCSGVAQASNRQTVRKRKSLFFNREIEVVEPLSEDEAAQQGAEILGQAILLAVALGIMYDQWRRENERNEAFERRIVQLENQLSSIQRDSRRC
eukprot:Hpha_TRINITY_DN27002_c0_g1::TRINITY_DN27002_c0_g1_i1::g.33141::m.33141